MKNEIVIQAYQDGIEITFPLTSLPDYQFKALSNCLKRNREAGKITIYDAFLSKDNIFIIRVGDIQNHVHEFIQLIECELLMTLTYETSTDSLHKKIMDEFHKLVDNPVET